MNEKVKISASLVLYNTPFELVNSVIKSYAPAVKRKLYIIDNSQQVLKEYGVLKNIEYVDYIFNGINLGYGKAHNIGIKNAIKDKVDYHIVLNPDLIFEAYIIDEIANYMNNNRDVVYVLPKVVYPNGEIQYLCKLLPTPIDLIFRRFLPDIGVVRRMKDKYILKASGYNRIMNPPCLSGCFMFMRVNTLEINKLFFDERFFMYCEDFDLMRRLHRVGKTIYYPQVQIIHNHARQSYRNKKMLFMHIKSACIYFNKYGWFFDKERKRMNKKILEELCEKVKGYE